MNILELTINDVKRISAVEINSATGEPVILTGDNAQGKSSVLDSIEVLLTNKGLDDPIRHGRTSAKITAGIGDSAVEYTLERKFTRSGDTLTIVGPDGVKVPSPQKFLNSLVGSFAFDPLAFTGLKPKEQVEALKQAAGLDFSKLDEERATAFTTRTDVGRRGKEAAAQLAAIPEPLPGTPEEEVSAAEVVAALNQLHQQLSAHQAAENRIESLKTAVAQAQAEVTRIGQLLVDAQTALSEKNEDLTAAKENLLTLPLPDEETLATASLSVNQVDQTNAAVREARKYRELKTKTENLRKEYADLTAQIEQIDAEKLEKVKSANLPLEGLELTDDGVIFNGTLFSQLSTAEQIRISTLVAMAQNSALKIILVREGTLINRANLALMAALAAERGCQLWIEKFQEDPSDTGLHIVDGRIGFVSGKAVSV
ncbi:MAG: hypothetical protein QM627_10185 [Luteolibacter sp.]